MKTKITTALFVAALAAGTASAQASAGASRDAFLKQQAVAEMQRVSAQVDVLATNQEELSDRIRKTEAMKNEIIKSFKLIVDTKHVAIILDENDKAVCIGVCFPSIARAVQKSRGKLTPLALIRLLRAIKHPSVIDFGLIAVDPTYLNRGVSTAISAEILKILQDDSIEYAETNLNLEDNAAIQNQWKRFKEVKHKRRRAYVKKI